MELDTKSEEATQAKKDLFDLLPDEIILRIIEYSAASINFKFEYYTFEEVVKKLISRGHNFTSTCVRLRAFRKNINQQIKKLLVERYPESEFTKTLFEAASAHHEEIIRDFDDTVEDPAIRNGCLNSYWNYSIKSRVMIQLKKQLMLLSLIQKLSEIGIEFDLNKVADNSLNLPKQFIGLTPLMIASRYNNVPMVNWLISNNCNIDDTDKDGQTAFFRLVSNRPKRIMTRVPAATSYNDLVQLKLYYGVEKFSYEVAKLLLHAGAQINIKDNKNSTPIMTLILRDAYDHDVNIGVFLVQNGASLKMPNGKSILKKMPRLKKRLKEEDLIKTCNIV